MAAVGLYIVVILFLSLIAAAIILGVKYFKYKRHISNVLNGVEEKKARISSPGETVSWVLVAILILWNGINLTQISFMQSTMNTLQDQVAQLNRDYTIYSQDLSYRIDNISSPVSYAEMILDRYEEKDTVVFKLKLILKEYSDNTAVSVKFGDNVTEMTGNDGTFTGEARFNMFNAPIDSPLVIVKEGDICKTAEVEEFSVGPIWTDILPGIYAQKLPYDVKCKGNTFTIDSDMWIAKEPYKDGIEMTEAYILFEINAEPVERISIDLAELENSDKVVIPIKRKYDVKPGDDFVIYTVVENTLGYSVKTFEWSYRMKEAFPQDSDFYGDNPFRMVYKTDTNELVYCE